MTGNPIASLPTSWRIVAWVGFPAAVCAFLLFFVTNVVAKRLDKIEETLAKQQASYDRHVGNETVAIQQNWQIVGTLQQVCLNVSKTNQDRLACVSATRAPQ